LTFCVHHRTDVFTDATIVRAMLEQAFQAATVRQFEILAYCFMPDHLHLLVEARSSDSDLISFANLVKQRTSYTYRQSHRERLWQKGYFEHIVRDDELTQIVAKYVLENPVRAGLVKEPLEYAFSGSLVYSSRQLMDLWHEGTPFRVSQGCPKSQVPRSTVRIPHATALFNRYLKCAVARSDRDGFASSAKLCNAVKMNGGKLLVLWDVADASRL
jgi:putative transposase